MPRASRACASGTARGRSRPSSPRGRAAGSSTRGIARPAARSPTTCRNAAPSCASRRGGDCSRRRGASVTGVQYLEFLRGLHQALAPPTYLEVGVRNGRSLALAECRAVGIDPAYNLKATLGPKATLYRETSDEYFDRPEPLKAFGD